MQLRQKIIFLAITPLVLALGAIALAVRHQAAILASQQRATIQQAYLDSKQTELKNYVALASRSIADLYASGNRDRATLEQAKRILGSLDYGDDGYFFVYDLNGKNLMHPRQPELVGKNLWQMKDAAGNPTIQRLIAQARAGGGFVRYEWSRPSTGKSAPKLGYVVVLPAWGWMLGTGIYLDDVDAALAAVAAQEAQHIDNTMLWIASIAILMALLVAACGLALNIRESRVADAKLKALAQRVVVSQEEERARLSRDLHDGISQCLVSIKLQIEAGLIRLTGKEMKNGSAAAIFERSTEQLNGVLSEVRRISHNLRPAILDDLGLAAALEHLAQEFSECCAIPVSFAEEGVTDGLSEVANTVLFRIAQEALTNIKRHAGASRIEITLSGTQRQVCLRIADDGAGFDLGDVAQHPKRGIGLRNMSERMEAINGHLQLSSTKAGTVVLARVAA
jgi:two-component system NarL family sensor kinase